VKNWFPYSLGMWQNVICITVGTVLIAVEVNFSPLKFRVGIYRGETRAVWCQIDPVFTGSRVVVCCKLWSSILWEQFSLLLPLSALKSCWEGLTFAIAVIKWLYEAHPQSKFPWGRVQKQNTIAWKYLLQ
jgi:hypothetical protein